MAENNQRTTTSTQIRNFYSDGMSYLNVSFFNTNLAFKFYPFVSKDNTGKSTYDMQHGQNTTVNFEGAYALYQVAKDIINGKIQETNLPIPCAGGASLTLERKLGQDGRMETVFSISKNGVIIPFKFDTLTQQIKENGQVISITVESGLGAFMKTVEGYLNGINADRHLDKLTDDFAKSQQNQGGNQQSNYGNGGYKKPYQNNYKKSYNNQGGGNFSNQQNGQPSWAQQQPRQQNMSDYTIRN